jgi:hypothetical protein
MLWELYTFHQFAFKSEFRFSRLCRGRGPDLGVRACVRSHPQIWVTIAVVILSVESDDPTPLGRGTIGNFIYEGF